MTEKIQLKNLLKMYNHMYQILYVYLDILVRVFVFLMPFPAFEWAHFLISHVV